MFPDPTIHGNGGKIAFTTPTKIGSEGEDEEQQKKNRYGAENYPGGLWTVPGNTLAYSNNIGDEGGFNA